MTPTTSLIPALIIGCLVALGVVMAWDRMQMNRPATGATNSDRVLFAFLTLALVDMAVFLGYLFFAAHP